MEYLRLAALGKAFLDAPLAAGGWEDALRALARDTGSSPAQLLSIGGARAIRFNWTTDMDPRFAEDFVTIGGGDAAINWRVAAAGTPMTVVHEHDYARIRRTMRPSVYEDYVAEYRIQHGCQAVLTVGDDAFIGMALLRSEADGPTGEADRALFAAALPSIVAAVRLQTVLEDRGSALVAGALEAMGTVGLFGDAAGRFEAVTPEADRWLSGGGALRLAEGRLSAVQPEQDPRLQELDRAVAAGRRSWARTILGRAQDGSRCVCEIFRLPRREWAFGRMPELLIVVRTGETPAAVRPEALCDAFGMSMAEAEVALLAAWGHSRAEIAALRGTSPETVRSQMKAVFAALGIARQHELVQRVRALPAD